MKTFGRLGFAAPIRKLRAEFAFQISYMFVQMKTLGRLLFALLYDLPAWWPPCSHISYRQQYMWWDRWRSRTWMPDYWRRLTWRARAPVATWPPGCQGDGAGASRPNLVTRIAHTWNSGRNSKRIELEVQIQEHSIQDLQQVWAENFFLKTGRVFRNITKSSLVVFITITEF